MDIILPSSGLYYYVIQIIYHIIIIIIADIYDFFLGSSGDDVTSTKVTVYRGPKGSFHRKQENPRASRKTDWLAVFITNYCQGSEDECRRVLGRFESFNESGNKKEANDILSSVYVEQGARECMLREVFKIGSERYKKILHNQIDKIGGGRNGFAVNKDMLDQLYNTHLCQLSNIVLAVRSPDIAHSV